MLNVLIACEESQAVCKEFRRLGHRAFSCDIQECSGGHPEWHVHGDVLHLLSGECKFQTQDTHTHTQTGEWDLIIAHPPCTYLSNVATRHFSLRCTEAEKVVHRWKDRAEAAVFFMYFPLARCKHIAVENPIGFMNTAYRKPDQIIHPYMFAKSKEDKENYVTKTTCLWLIGLPNLKTNGIEKPNNRELFGCHPSGKARDWEAVVSGGERGKLRSKTFSGIAKAMAEQWSAYIESEAKYDVVHDYIQFKLF